MNGDLRFLGRAFDHDFGDAGGFAELLLRNLRILNILMQERCRIPCGRTSGCPRCG